MIPKEKAIELINKFWHVEPFETQEGMEVKMAIDCALIAVDEILNELFEMAMVTGSSYVHKHIDYYQEVKQELAIL